MKNELVQEEKVKEKSKLFGRPRLSESEKRSVKLSLFLTVEEAETIKEKCSRTTLSAPEFVRRTALARHIESRIPEFDSEALDLLRRCFGDISKIKRDLIAARNFNLEIDLDYIEKRIENQLSILRKLNRKIVEK